MVPDVGGAVFTLAFCVKAVRLGHTASFVVSTYQRYAAGVAELEADEQGDGFDAEKSAIDIVTCGEG